MNHLSSWLKGANLFSFNNPVKITTSVSGKEDVIQLALLLDTSGSMDGLIEQAKSQLWKIVNELSRADRSGKSPNLEIALYQYGNDGLSSFSGYIQQISPFTSDMDHISKNLFALRTNGGNEYCGKVIHTSLSQLDWTKEDGKLRLIYIAGNEAFSQGPLHFTQACNVAKNMDVVVNTIFCGAHRTGIDLGWKTGASLTGGEYYSIDQNQETVYISSPYDDEIEQLNDELNNTYVPYGNQGASYLFNQSSQDANAEKYSRVNKVDRAVFKSSKLYTNAGWDLIDGYCKDKSILKNKEDLPEELKNLSDTELEKKIKTLKVTRDEIQGKIQDLDKKRRKYFYDNSDVTADSTNLEYSIKKSLKKQANKKGYQIKE